MHEHLMEYLNAVPAQGLLCPCFVGATCTDSRLMDRMNLTKHLSEAHAIHLVAEDTSVRAPGSDNRAGPTKSIVPVKCKPTAFGAREILDLSGYNGTMRLENDRCAKCKAQGIVQCHTAAPTASTSKPRKCEGCIASRIQCSPDGKSSVAEPTTKDADLSGGSSKTVKKAKMITSRDASGKQTTRGETAAPAAELHEGLIGRGPMDQFLRR